MSISAESLKTRNDVMKLTPGEEVKAEKNGFTVRIERIICAQGGDMCIMGRVKSYMPHPYKDITYGDFVIWGPRGICKSNDILDYINRRKFLERV